MVCMSKFFIKKPVNKSKKLILSYCTTIAGHHIGG